MADDVYILDAVRTPFGRLGGALAAVRPDDLAAHAVRSLVERSPDLDPARIDDVLLGDANGAGEDNRNVGRMASRAAIRSSARAYAVTAAGPPSSFISRLAAALSLY